MAKWVQSYFEIVCSACGAEQMTIEELYDLDCRDGLHGIWSRHCPKCDAFMANWKIGMHTIGIELKRWIKNNKKQRIDRND